MICATCGVRGERHADFADCLASLRARIEALEAKVRWLEKKRKDKEKD